MEEDVEQVEEEQEAGEGEDQSGGAKSTALTTLAQTFGDDVETVVQFHDNQSISVPLVAPKVARVLKFEDKKVPKTSYSKEYLWESAQYQNKMRNVAVVGSLHAGKTSLVDNLVLETHTLKNISKSAKINKRLRYTDNQKLERERGLTVKSSLITMLLPNLKGNSVVCNLMDTPGHINFADEIAVAQRSCDISLVVVDVVEGLSITTKTAIDNALINNLQLCFLINKIDRLVLELRLPPLDSFFKIRNVIDEINSYVQDNQYFSEYKLGTIYSPELNNVAFGSTDLGFSFTVKSFALKYMEMFNMDKTDIDEFYPRLWGDIYYDEHKSRFSKKGEKRSFIHFILEPIYKIITQSITNSSTELIDSFKQLGIKISKDISESDPKVILKFVFNQFFSRNSSCHSGLVDIIESLNPSCINYKHEVFSKNDDEKIISLIKNSSNDAPLIAFISKMIDKDVAIVRILSGTITKGDEIKILGENYSDDDDDEDIETITVSEMYLSGGRYKVPVEQAYSGSIILLGGVNTISKSGTIFGSKGSEGINLSIFKPINYLNKPVFKIVIEPQIPSELPKLLDGLRTVNKIYCGCEIKVEESGEHVIFGSGELYLDSLLYDLRNIADINIKVSDPITRFQETIINESLTKISIKSVNLNNEITIICSPMENKLGYDIEKNKLMLNKRKQSKLLREEYNWDSLSARSVIAFGPEDNGANILLDDILYEEGTDKKSLETVKLAVIQGFKWAVREGPLCDEPIRNVIFKIIDLKVSDEANERSNGQIIPMVRKACYASFLLSKPKLMEPIYAIEILILNYNYIKVINKILDKRRGCVLKSEAVSGTQMFRVYGVVPVIDSIGVETDIRITTSGQSSVSLYFDKWSLVPGNPTDTTIKIPKLTAVSNELLARDFMVKTRKRKGLSGEPSLVKYIDKELVEKLQTIGLLE